MLPYNKQDLRRLPNPSVVFIGVLFLDQILKSIFLSAGDFQRNYGSLFGAEINLFFPALILLFLFLMAKRRKYLQKRSFSCAWALVAGGILSNVADRIRLGFVVDYIDLMDMFSFNLADLAIFVGAGFFIWQIIRE